MLCNVNVCASKYGVVRACSLLLVSTFFSSIAHAFGCSPVSAGHFHRQRHASLKSFLTIASLKDPVQAARNESDKQDEMDRDMPTLHRPFCVRLCQKNATRHENLCLRRLSARMHTLERVLAGVSSAIMSADDVAFGERRATSMGEVYLDASLTTARRPRWLRRSIQEVLDKHSFPANHPETHWHARDIVEELDSTS